MSHYPSRVKLSIARSIVDMLLRLGQRFVSFLRYIGGVTILGVRTIFLSVRPPFDWRETIIQMQRIGVNSLPIVFLVAFFTGMVLSLQSAYQMQKIAAEIYIASLVSLSMVRELGPVLTSLVLAGRIGASITAQIGTMKVTEQVDALEAMATDPVKYLVVPRYVAAIIMLPLLTVYADFIGIFGGFVIGVFKLNISPSIYMNMSFDPLLMKDLVTGLSKTVLFGMIISIVGCFEGLTTEGGAEGVGLATTRSVVISFILIIVTDCLCTALFYFVL